MKVTIVRECNCTKRLSLSKEAELPSKELAMQNAQKKCAILKQKSCQMHTFFITEKEGEICIDSKLNTDKII